jgi:adenine-specific DNA methylase
LPKTFDENSYYKISSLTEAERSGKVIYIVSPKRKVIEERLKEISAKIPCDVTVLDPMAGGGSIPLEVALLRILHGHLPKVREMRRSR